MVEISFIISVLKHLNDVVGNQSPPKDMGRWRASQGGTCSCHSVESASWKRTFFWVRAAQGLCTALLRPAGGDKDHYVDTLTHNVQFYLITLHQKSLKKKTPF